MYAVSVQEEGVSAAFPKPEETYHEHEHAHHGVDSDHAEKTDTTEGLDETGEAGTLARIF
jgi:hypothetical protein